MPDFEKNGEGHLLEIRGLSKSFPGVKALDSVDFTLRRGEIHALMGENGAGKSTLINVLTGLYPKDEGTILLDGTPFVSSSPMDATSRGISTVYQEINLLPNLSIAENISAGRQPMNLFGIDWKETAGRAEAALSRLEISVDVSLPLASVSIAMQQMVAIARALDVSARVLILDEPTSSLDSGEAEQLFRVMRRMRDEGIGIIFITHFLDQLYQTSDTVTVLRNGKLVGESNVSELARMELVSMMLGKELAELDLNPTFTTTDRSSNGETALLRTEGLGKAGSVNPFDIEVRPGEVLGLAGLLGSGRTETAKLLFGIDRPDTGKMYIRGKAGGFRQPKHAIEASFGFCPEDRKTEGVIPELTVRENITLAQQAARPFFRPISRKEQQTTAEEFINRLKVVTSGTEQTVGTLSGGNQQKVILARWLAMEPDLLILDEPTRGIDVGAKAEIERLIRRLADEGKAIIFISSELEEVIRCSDRVIVLRDRNKVGELIGTDINEQQIMSMLAQGVNS